MMVKMMRMVRMTPERASLTKKRSKKDLPWTRIEWRMKSTGTKGKNKVFSKAARMSRSPGPVYALGHLGTWALGQVQSRWSGKSLKAFPPGIHRLSRATRTSPFGVNFVFGKGLNFGGPLKVQESKSRTPSPLIEFTGLWTLNLGEGGAVWKRNCENCFQ